MPITFTLASFPTLLARRTATSMLRILLTRERRAPRRLTNQKRLFKSAEPGRTWLQLVMILNISLYGSGT